MVGGGCELVLAAEKEVRGLMLSLLEELERLLIQMRYSIQYIQPEKEHIPSTQPISEVGAGSDLKVGIFSCGAVWEEKT